MASRSTSTALSKIFKKSPAVQGNLTIVKEAYEIHSGIRELRERGQDAFVIATVRNPCDWYLSNWMYLCLKELKYTNPRVIDFCGVLKIKQRRDAIRPVHFHRYMLSNQSKWLTELLYRQYVSDVRIYASWGRNKQLTWQCGDARGSSSTPPSSSSSSPTRVGPSVDIAGCQLVPEMLAGAPSLATTLVDCWVFVSDLDADLRRCVKAWLTSRGLDPSEVLSGYQKAPETHKLKNSSSCSSWYTPELEARVKQADSELFALFNYSTCCGPAAGRRMGRHN